MKKTAALCFCILALCLCAGCAAQPPLPHSGINGQSGTTGQSGISGQSYTTGQSGGTDGTAAAAPPDAAVTPQTPADAEYGVWPKSRLHYDRLNETQKLLYREMYAVAAAFAESGPLTPAGKEQLDAAFLALCADHPELFWLESYRGSYTRRGETIVSVEFCPGYGMTAEERQRFAAALESLRADLFAAMDAALPANAADADRALYLLEHIVQNTRYDETAPYSQSAVSCLAEGRALCAGYARALQYLLASAGISCSLVNGTANGTAHAWVLAKLDGSWYHMDPTWADSDHAVNGRELLHWEYFAMNDAQLAPTHTPGESGLPACTGEAASLFVRRGTQLAAWDTVVLENLLRTAARQGQSDLCLELTTQEAWDKAVNALATGGLHHLLQAAAEDPALDPPVLQYYKNDARRVLHLILTRTAGTD